MYPRTTVLESVASIEYLRFVLRNDSGEPHEIAIVRAFRESQRDPLFQANSLTFIGNASLLVYPT